MPSSIVTWAPRRAAARSSAQQRPELCSRSIHSGPHYVVAHVLIGLSVLVGGAHAQCMTANRYDQGHQPTQCDALIASGEYTCAGAFDRGMKYASLCDLSCGFNAHDTRETHNATMGGCDSMLLRLYSCSEHFATGKAYEGYCDFACGFCTARSAARRLQDVSTCAARARTIADGAESAVAQLAELPPFPMIPDYNTEDVRALFPDSHGPDGGWRSGKIDWAEASADATRDAAGGALSAETRLDFQVAGWTDAAAQGISVHACTLWESLTGNVECEPTGCTHLSRGGAVFMAAHTTLTVSGSAFLRNSATEEGGAVYVASAASLNVSGSVFAGNRAGCLENWHDCVDGGWYSSGGAISADPDAQLDVSSSAFIGNTAQGFGGAIYVREGGSRLVVSSSFFTGNRAAMGAAIMVLSGRLAVSRCAFIGNYAWQGTGTVSLGRELDRYTGRAIVSGSLFMDNRPQSGIWMQSGRLDLIDSTLRNHGLRAHAGAHTPMRFYVYNTSVDRSVSLDVLAGCEQYPCSEGFGCSYENYSLTCTPCPGSLISRDGIRCVLPFLCAPGTRCAAVSGCNDQSECTPCNDGTVSDGSGECIACDGVGERANDARTACIPCVAGTEPSLNRSRCVSCGVGKFSEGRSCEPCPVSASIRTSVPNEGRTACVPCPAGTKPSTAGDSCICDSSYYNATSIDIRCYESAFQDASSSAALSTGCGRCGSCVDCEGPARVRPQYVRLNLSMSSSTNGRLPATTYDSRAQQLPVTIIPVFKCKSVYGCFGLDSTDAAVSGCQQNYTGYLCESCDIGFERIESESESGCQACSSLPTRTWVVAAAIAVFAAVVAKARHLLSRAFAPSAAQVNTFMAVGRSAWEPIRILVSYAQVTSQVGASLSVHYPPMFTAIARQLAGLLDVIDLLLDLECLGLSGFHTQWLAQVVMFPLVLTAVSLSVFAVDRIRSSRETAMKHLAGNVFFIVFVCYPRVCQVSFNAWICRPVLQDLSILVADDRVACENRTHVIYQGLSLIVLGVVALGVPVAAIIILYRARKAQPTVPESLKLRTAEALAITTEEAEFTVNDIRLGSSYGFLVDTFKPKFFYWESIDMLRKLALLGLVLLFERGSVNQIAISLIMSFFFLVAHLRAHPYKHASDNYLRTATELHVFLTIATGLVFRTDLDNPFASQLVGEGSFNVDADVRRLYEEEAQARKSSYDSLLLVTFIILVAGASLATIATKMLLVARAIASQADQESAMDGKQDVLIRAAYTRFRLGLATGSDHLDLVDFIDQLCVNKHVRAGKRLWREKHLVSHFTTEQMRAMLRDIEQRLPKSTAIAYHFTDLDAARVILDQSQGLRASTVGQLGGGVSVCLASPVALGWDKHGGESMTFCQRVGDELWGSKAHEVLPGVPPAGAHTDYGKFHNKLEVLLLVQIAAKENRDSSRVVPGRDNVYIIDSQHCEPGTGTDTGRYYSNLNIKRCLVLKSPDSEAGQRRLDTLAARPHSPRVKVQSRRNEYNGMTEVTLKEVDWTERIDDDLTPLGNWCPAVTTFTAAAAHPSDGASTVRQFHQMRHQSHRDRVIWPENIARFTLDEMSAALHSIDQSLPQCYMLAFHYTSAANANRMCKEGKGIDAVESGDFVRASLCSPVDLGWQKNSGGRFKDTAGTTIWGSQWHHTHPDKVQAVLVLGIPIEELTENLGTIFQIPEPLLATDETTGTTFYPNAHIYKSYLLDPDAAPKKPQATATESGEKGELAKLFARVDVDGDGQVTREEAMRYFREQEIDLDEKTVAMIFEGVDSNGDGTVDIAEFPRLMDAVRRAAAKAAAPDLLNRSTSATTEASSSKRYVSTQRQGSSDKSEAAMLFERIDSDGSGLISFNEFVDWWAHRRLNTGHVLDEAVADKMQQQWHELDRDGSGDLDEKEFETLMTEIATSEWKEAFDKKKGKVYYYNARTRETRWGQPDTKAAVQQFIVANGLSAPKQPPSLANMHPPGQEDSTTSAATETTTNPLSTPASLSSRVGTFDIETPPALDTLKRRSAPRVSQMRVAGRVVRHSTADARAADTGRALPRRPVPRRPPPHVPLHALVGLSVLVTGAHAQCMTANRYDQGHQPTQCDALIASGEYTCAGAFDRGMKYASLCDLSCGFNAHDTRETHNATMGGCDSMLLRLYSCSEHFATGKAYEGYCDFACGFCTARSAARRLQDVSTCAARARTIADGAESAVAQLPTRTWHEAQSTCATIVGAVTAAMRLDFQHTTVRTDVAAQGNDVHACKLWEDLGANDQDNESPMARGGAVMLAELSTLSVSGSAFISNDAQGHGGYAGAVYMERATLLTVNGSAFVCNRGNVGGALYVDQDAQATVSGSTFIGNYAAEGGAIHVRDRGRLVVSGSTFIDNNAGNGGAIFVMSGQLIMSNCAFITNNAALGGALQVSNTECHVSGSTFIRNSYQTGGRGSAIRIMTGSLDLIDSTLLENGIGNRNSQNIGSTIDGDHIHAEGPDRFYVYNTTISPCLPLTTASMMVDVLAGCEQYPCSEGFGCSYENYSLTCTPCPGSLISRDGIRCVLPFLCAPGTRCAAVSGCNDQSECTPCNDGTVSDGSGECIACDGVGERANDARTACIPCVAGTEPSLNRSRCVSCGVGKFSEGRSCEPCPVSASIRTSVPNEGRTACVPCPAGTKPSTAGDSCICDSSYYNATSIDIRCYESAFQDASSSAALSTGCGRCGSCVDCEGPARVRPQYVRLNLSMSSSTNGRLPATTYDSRAQQLPVTIIPVFKCKSVYGCFGLDSTDAAVSGCQQNYTGYLCESCDIGFERIESESESGCQACSSLPTRTWVVAAAIAVFAAVVAKARHLLSRAFAPSAAQVNTFMAVGRSAWEPIRILVSYAQVTSQVGASLSVHYPPMFTAIARQLAGLLDVIDLLLDLECLGLSGFHTQWLAQVVMFPLVLTAVSLSVFAVDRIRSSRETAMKHLAGNVFFIVFVCYPRVCQVSFNAWICRPVLQDLSILVADDRVACENRTHVIYQGLSLIVLGVVALGVPVAAIIILYRARKAQPTVPESLKLRTAEALAITTEEAEFTVNDIRLGSSYGFLVDTFKPKFFYWESIDMLRKLALLGLVLLFERGSVNQIAISLIMSFFFLVAHLRAHPYKHASDNYLRTATELHVFLTIATGLVFRTDLDNPFASQLVGEGSFNVDADVRRLYEEEAQARKSSYDSLLLVTFIILVAGASLATIATKMLLVARAIASQADQESAMDGKQDVLIRAAYTRFRLGLATGSDHLDLVDFIDQLCVNKHVRAGKRLWREKHLVSHFTTEQMRAMLRDIEQRLPKSTAIAYHFTDLDAARVILDQSQGLRASTVGQLGGGVSVCLASPVALGWDKHGGESMTFCQRVGDELWGSKAHEVLPGVPPAGAHTDYGKFHNKLEVLLLVQIAAKENRDSSRVVPGRDNVYIIDSQHCEPGTGTDTGRYYSNLNIKRCLVLKSPDSEAGQRRLDTLAARPHSPRVKVQSRRNEYNGMTEVTLKEVDWTERIDDDLTPLGNWCPAVTTFTAAAAHPSDGASTVRQFHQMRHQSHRDRVIWPENIARFTLDEMSAALHSIDQSLPQCYMLAFHYTSAANANRMCKEGKGIDAVESGDFVRASLCSPVDLGWQKNSGGRFKDTAGTTIWGSQWHHTHPDKVQAVLVLGIPIEELTENLGTIFQIPEPLLATDETTGTTFYPNAHIYKSYLLDPDAAPKKPQATATESGEKGELAKLFARVDVDGDGQVTREEAMRYFREQEIDLDEKTVAMIFEGVDSNGDGTVDIAEFPRLMDAVRRAAAKAAAPDLLNRSTSATTEASSSKRYVSTQRQGSSDKSEAAMLFERIDSDGSGLISFNEFVDWWAHRRLNTGHVLDEAVADKMQQQWHELDRDGSGDLDEKEFETLMTEIATSEWKEAFDKKKGKVYYYNARTRETRWGQPDTKAAVQQFIVANGLSAPKQPPSLANMHPPGQEDSTTSAATETTTNPLSTPASLSSRVGTFDIETPPALDTLKRRSAPRVSQMRVAGRVVRHSTADARAADTGRALPRRPVPRRPDRPGPRPLESSV